jgi:hypothetical protein
VECSNGIKLFAGQRLDPFPYPVTTTNCLAAGTFPDFPSLGPAHNDFANTAVRSTVLEVPVAITGRGRVHFWASTAYFDTGHNIGCGFLIPVFFVTSGLTFNLPVRPVPTLAGDDVADRA